MTASIVLAVAAAASTAFAFDLQGHRGARGLAPENTLAGFRRALEIGVTTIETDLAVTADERIVLVHDPRLNPALVRHEGSWLAQTGPAVRTLTLAALRAYDVGRLDPDTPYARQWPGQRPADGERVPTLDELFELVRAHGRPVRLNLETKLTPAGADDAPEPKRFAELAVGAVRRAGFAGRTTIQSFDWRTLVEVRRVAPEIETACLTIVSRGMDTVSAPEGQASAWHAGLRLADHGGSLPRVVKAAGCAVWSMFWRNLTPELHAEAKSLGLRVVPWTVNREDDMHRLIGMGVDGLITDYPDRLRRVMSERGLTLP